MTKFFLEELTTCLADSRAYQRKKWAQQIDEQKIPLRNLFFLWHGEPKTAQRFMWLIGDICDQNIELVREEMAFLFSIRNQMPFPGMDRSVAKWLWLTEVPKEIEKEATEQLLDWMNDPKSPIACKAHASQALYLLAINGRMDKKRILKPFSAQTLHSNKAYTRRISKQLADCFPDLDTP